MDPHAHLFHLALTDDWERATHTGEYTMSTRGLTLSQVGFIHLSYGHQWPATRARFYADLGDNLLLLQIDPAGLDIRAEVGNPETGELFPHLYGPLPVARVIDVRTLAAPHDRG